MYLLDTCTLLWLAADKSKLSGAAHEAIANEDADLFVCSISAFEIGVKQQRGALVLAMSADAWFETALEFHGLREIPVDGLIASRSTLLPRHHHDPCDRMIIAAAVEHGLTVLTPDPLIRKYEETLSLW